MGLELAIDIMLVCANCGDELDAEIIEAEENSYVSVTPCDCGGVKGAA